jgi:hypothetical protein
VRLGREWRGQRASLLGHEVARALAAAVCAARDDALLAPELRRSDHAGGAHQRRDAEPDQRHRHGPARWVGSLALALGEHLAHRIGLGLGRCGGRRLGSGHLDRGRVGVGLGFRLDLRRRRNRRERRRLFAIGLVLRGRHRRQTRAAAARGELRAERDGRLAPRVGLEQRLEHGAQVLAALQLHLVGEPLDRARPAARHLRRRALVQAAQRLVRNPPAQRQRQQLAVARGDAIEGFGELLGADHGRLSSVLAVMAGAPRLTARLKFRFYGSRHGGVAESGRLQLP